MKYVGVGLGAMIRAARMRRGMTQDQLAERIGAVGSYVSQIETGARKWPQELIPALADALKLDEIDMAIAAGLIRPRQDRSVEPADPFRERVNELLDEVRFSEDRQDTLEGILEMWRDADRRKPQIVDEDPIEEALSVSY